MLTLRVPFGGGSGSQTPAFVALTGGPVWRTAEATDIAHGRLYHVPTIALGWALSGQPIARIGGIDLTNAEPVQISAEEEAGTAEDDVREGANAGRTLLLIGLGVLAVLGIAAVVDSVRDCKSQYCGLP